jgi:predicted phage terminase large subunit-like protein
LQVLLLRESTESVFNHIFALLRKGGNTVVIEANGCQDYLADQLENEAVKRKIPINLERIKYHGASKEQRIGSLKPFINVGTISFNKDDRAFLEQMRVFPYGEHDDGPDAMEMAVRALMNMRDGLTSEKADQMKDALQRLKIAKEFPITKTIHQQMFPKVYKGREESMIRHFPRLKGFGSGKIAWY